LASISDEVPPLDKPFASFDVSFFMAGELLVTTVESDEEEDEAGFSKA